MQKFLFYANFQRKTNSARRLLDLNLYIEKKIQLVFISQIYLIIGFYVTFEHSIL